MRTQAMCPNASPQRESSTVPTSLQKETLLERYEGPEHWSRARMQAEMSAVAALLCWGASSGRQQQQQQLAEQPNFKRRVLAENIYNISPRNDLGKGVKYFLTGLGIMVELGNYGYNIRSPDYPI